MAREGRWGGVLRQGGRHFQPAVAQVEEARLRRERAVKEPSRHAVSVGSCVITGGLGGLGLRAAAMLSSNGAAWLLLTSRSGRVAREGQGLEALLSTLSASAMELLVLPCDVSDAVELHSLLSVSMGRPSLSVLHASGVGDKGLVRELSDWRIGLTCSPKALPARHLHTGTHSVCVGSLVMYSSVAAALGRTPTGSVFFARPNQRMITLGSHFTRR